MGYYPVITGLRLSSGAGAGKVLTSDAHGDASWAAAAAGSGVTWSTVTSATDAAANNGYLCNTAAGAFTVTLPAAPSVGDQIYLADAAGTWATLNLTVGRNALNIMGLAEDLIMDVNYLGCGLVYASAALGWRIV
jgi:hypothetical protein